MQSSSSASFELLSFLNECHATSMQVCKHIAFASLLRACASTILACCPSFPSRRRNLRLETKRPVACIPVGGREDAEKVDSYESNVAWPDLRQWVNVAPPLKKSDSRKRATGRACCRRQR
jgi:hypothetical protein